MATVVSRGERLLDLVLEYQQAKEAEERTFVEFGAIGTPGGRDPEVIAADYEAELRALLS